MKKSGIVFHSSSKGAGARIENPLLIADELPIAQLPRVIRIMSDIEFPGEIILFGGCRIE